MPSLTELSSRKNLSILPFGHGVYINVAAGFFPDEILLGNIEPAILQFGTPQQVYELSKVAMPPRCLARERVCNDEALNDFGGYD